jgi:hypothetical protein
MSRFALALLLFVAPAAAAAQQIDTLTLRSHTYYLAHELLEGRGTGTRGEWLAAHYIISQLKRLGIPGAGPGGAYLQPVPLRTIRIIHDRTTLELDAGTGGTRLYRSGDDFVVNTGGAGAFRDFEGRLLFLGTPAEALAWTTASGGRMDGVVPVVVGPLGAAAATLVPAWIRRGAEGVLLLIEDPDLFDTYRRSRGDDRYFVTAEVDDPVWQPGLPVLLAGPAIAGVVSAGARSGGFPVTPPAGASDARVRLRLQAVARDVAAANVAGLIPGSDPGRRGEVVVLTAHYDHLGIGDPVEGDSIYDGFSDNAAGVAMVLAIAEALRQAPAARSVLLLFFTGEERGLLGSTYYTTAPLLPLDSIAGLINLDAGAPPAPPVSWRIAATPGSELGFIARNVATARGWSAEIEPATPSSDHWPFANRGVPAVFLIPGRTWEGLDEADRATLHARWDRYHQPSDAWSRDFPFAGLARYAEYALAVVRAAADAPTPAPPR